MFPRASSQLVLPTVDVNTFNFVSSLGDCWSFSSHKSPSANAHADEWNAEKWCAMGTQWVKRAEKH